MPTMVKLRMPGWWAALAWLAPVALALLLVTTNVRLTTNSLYVYERLFERNQVPARTGITLDGLRDVGRQIQDYFGSDAEPLRVTAVVNSVPRDLFGADEASHMSDVKQLFLKTYRAQVGSVLFLLVAAAAAVVLHRRRSSELLASWLRRGSLISAVAILVVGLASLVAFDQVFLLFHYIGFPEGNFTFNTTTDYLVRVFPNGFWEDITFLVGLMTLAEAALLYAVGAATPRLARRWARSDVSVPHAV